MSSTLASGRPISHSLTVATARSLPVRGPDAAAFAWQLARSRVPEVRRVRAIDADAPVRGLPALDGPPSSDHGLGWGTSCDWAPRQHVRVIAPSIGYVRDDGVLAPDERGLEALGRLVVQHPVPPVAGDVLGQDDDRRRGGAVRRPGAVEDVEVGDDRAHQRPVGRLDDDQRDARQLPLPAFAERLGLLRLGGHEHRLDHRRVGRQRPAEHHGLDDGAVDAVDGDHDPLLAVRLVEHEVGADVELGRLGVVLAPDEQHHADERRDEQQDEPRAVDELHRGHDDRR